ncbi:hypothetical protein GCM10010331_69820 [Streptomyces xanthochromogenes]|nr:hypothetical protein GCM10010331_69820 [Streptomyces xanthochromogenes]
MGVVGAVDAEPLVEGPCAHQPEHGRQDGHMGVADQDLSVLQVGQREVSEGDVVR